MPSLHRLLLALIVFVATLPVHTAAAQSGERCFAETNQCISGAIRQYWERNGGLAVFGFPTTPQALEDVEGRALQVQWFERDRIEIQSDGQVTAGRLGARLLELRGTPWQRGDGSGGDGCRVFSETGHKLCGAFLAYWERNGGLERFGFPLSGAFSEALAGGSFEVQYFERRRMERHPENAPPYDILLGLLGNEVRALAPQNAPAPAPAGGPTWLRYFNGLRALGGLAAASEEPAWSDGNAKHAAYAVQNNVLAHFEDPALPGYTPEGDAAARNSVLHMSYGCASGQPLALPEPNGFDAIDELITAPFHGISMLHPQLARTGFGQYLEVEARGRGECYDYAAGLDVLRGRGDGDFGVALWPGDGASSHLLQYSGGEFPDPLSPCGYTAPTGAPIYLQTGSFREPAVAVTTLLRDGQPVEHCLLSATAYTNPDSYMQELGRDILRAQGAVVLMPREPLRPGSTYSVQIDADGRGYRWSFRATDQRLTP
jgi:hypothetical protein